ncbi:hypothetical protein pETSU_133 [Edwardsiella phage pEt-SU]|uniref:Uncharacterized protein n=1 Tax=Edwardsiella phage pEt-SU TaxID=2562142 RepID=A0A4D6DWM9_9CAUD|nr:hypothetical protein HOV39_gp133 [Edwardsiella phage pEt-SU]QBZ70714.1 hypothetical protein pETSU_133 [Edwardsiella phage pEt-SU]
MAEMIKVNKKVINDPMYTPVRQWLTQRIAQLEIDGDPAELALAKERYDSLVAGDLVIEDVKTFADGIQRVCIVSRKTGFARVDIEFQKVSMQDILDDFGIPFVNIVDTDALKAFSKTNEEPAVLLWLEYKNTYGVLLTQDAATTVDGPMSAFGDLFFGQYKTERESLDWIDYDTIESGTVTITDPSIGVGIYPLFIQELVLVEANLPVITSNLPEFITTSRGDNFSIPNTYWFGGTLDITQTATVEITTAAGYTIPTRSDDKLSITGETIFGSSDNPVTDQIIVRVTHMYNGRPVRRTFRIQVRIDKDTAFDLTFEVRPATIKAARGDDVQVTVYGFFKGQPITIPSPPSTFASPKKYGDLTYVETLSDGGMIYAGKITGVPPLGLETDKDLYIATFNYVDGSTPYQAPAYINFELVRADSKPVFGIKGLTTTLRGYIDDQKQMEVKAFYGDTPVPAYNLGILPGPRGDLHQLIRVDSATADAVNYTVIRDSQKPGEDIEDSFEQKFTYLSDDGVKHTLFRTINIIISKVSVVQVIPFNDPRDVIRYQKGGPLFKVMVNGEDKTSQAIGLNMTWAAADDQFVTWEGNEWLIKYSTDTVRVVPVKFTWKQPYDGANHDMSYEGTLRIKVWDPNTNPGGGDGETGGGGGGDQGGSGNNDDGAVNTEVVVFPMYWGIDGDSDERGTVSFRVYSDGKEITKTAVLDSARTVMPPQLRNEGIRYDNATGMLVWTYYKLDEVEGGVAKLFYTDPKDGAQANLPANRRGRMYITANIKQSRVLRVTEQDTSEPVWLDETGRATLKLSFAGEPISLLDLNRAIISPNNPGTKQVTEVAVGEDYIDFTYTTLQGPNSAHNAPMEYEFSYTDPVTGELQKLRVVLNMTIRIQQLVITQFDDGVINTRMWETGSLNFKAMIGKRDITTLMNYNGGGLPVNRYVSFGGRSWTIIGADTQPHSEFINVRMFYTINVDYTQLTAYVPKTFNIDGWDGITFRHTLTPTDIVGNSGDEGEISGTFTYKYDNVTNGIRLDRTRSVIPDNIDIDEPIWDPVSEKAIIKYRLKRGYKYPMTLVFMHPTQSDTVTVPMTVDVKWAPGLNLESKQSTLSGYHTDVLDFVLKYNYSGVPVSNNNLAITYTAAPTGSTSLVEKQADKLRISLDQGGLQGTTYNCQFTVHAEYTDPDTQAVSSNELIVPTEIKVPTVAVGSNPVTQVKVYDRGQFRVKLVDSRGKEIPITLYTPNGTNNFVAFVAPNSYYVVKGDETQAVVTKLPLTLSYEIGGNAYTIDTEITFNITQFDGIDFVGTPVQSKLEGKAGDQAVAEFVFKYKGDVIHGVTLDPASIIPANLLIGQLTNSQLPYTLKGQGQDTAQFRFNRVGGSQTPVEGKDFVIVTLPVISTSSDEAFTLVSNDDEIELDWMTTGTLPIKVKYGDYELAGNAPGLSYKVTAAGDQGVVITSRDGNGVVLRADLASIPGTKKSYLDEIEVSYDVGAATPKTLKVQFNTRITTPIPTLTNNDKLTLSIYDRATFRQSLNFNQSGTGGVIAPTTRESIVPQTVPNQYVEMYTAFSFEVVGAPPTTSDVTVPLELTYTLKGVAEPQTFRFDTTLNIVGHVQPRFYCQFTPTVSEGVLGETRDVRFRPLYKDLPASTAVFRQDLSTIPAQVSITEVKKDPNNTEWTIVTLSGDAEGVGQCKFIWQYQEGAGEVSPELLSWEGDIQVRIMGEPGIEIGNRDNLIEGKHNDTGTYKLEILFGGLPLDTNAEIGKGLLTINVKSYNATDRNAQVMTITGTGADTFNYKLAGPLWVGNRAETKEILQLAYKYGGQTYTREVEVPLGYTSSAMVASGKDVYPILLADMFVDKDLSALSFMCDGLDLASTWTATGTVTQNGVKSKYIVYTGKKYRAEYAEQVATNTVVTTTFSSTYRGYPWTVDHDITYQLPAWDQKTYKVVINSEPTTLSVFVGETLDVLISEKFRAGGFGAPGDFLNTEQSDLSGVATLEYTSRTTSFGGYYWRYFTLKGMLPGTYNASLWFDRFINLDTFPYKDPKELYYDYYTRPIIFDVKVRPLTLSAPAAISAGNDDVKPSGTVTVKLNTLNIPVNDPNLVITALDPDVLTIETKTATSLTYRCKLPLNTAINSKFTANFKYAYTDPGTGLTHEGTQAVPVTYVNPADYPVVTGLVGGGPGNPLVLWKKFGQLFKITSGSNDITSQMTEFKNDPNRGIEFCQILDPFATTNVNWVQCIRGADVIGGLYSRQYWIFKAPFRGGTVDLSHTIEWYMYGVPANPAHLTGTYKPNPVFLKAGETGSIQFNLTYRGEKTVVPVMNDSVSDLKGVISVNSFDIDNATSTITVNYTALKEETNTLVFCWDLPGFDTYTDNINRLKMNVSVIPNVRIVLPDTPPNWDIYGNYPAPFTLMSGTTNLMDGLTASSTLPDVWVRNKTLTSTTGPVYQVIDAAKVDTLKTMKFIVTFTKGAFAGQTLEVMAPVNFKAWDQQQFKATVPLDTFPVADDGLPIISIGRGLKVNLTMSSQTRNADNPTWGNPGGQITTYSRLDLGLIASYNIVSATNNSAGGTQFTASINGLTNGYVKGKLAVDFAGNNTSLPNGYPPGTEGKNRQTFDVYYEVFEPELTWVGEVEPDEITIDASTLGNQIGYVERQLKFGRTPISYVNTTITLSDNTVVSTPLNNSPAKEVTRFPLRNLYINKYQDLHYQASITFSVIIGSVTYTKTYMQKVNLRGAGAAVPVLTLDNPHAVSAKVWERGPLPFDVAVNGSTTLPSGWSVKSVSIVDNSNVKMANAPAALTTWVVIAGDPTKPITSDVTFAVVVGDVGYRVTKNVTVRFNIAQYSGQELYANVRDGNFTSLTWWPERVVGVLSGGNSGIYFDVFYRGEPIPASTYSLAGPNGGSPYWTVRTVTTNQPAQIYMVIDGTAAAATQPNPITYQFRVYRTAAGPTGGVAGVDYVLLDVPMLGYGNKVLVISQDEGITGKFGDTIPFNCRVRIGLAEKAWGVSSNDLVRVYSLAPDTEVAVASYFPTGDGINFTFKKDITQEYVETNVIVTARSIDTPVAANAFNMKVKQLTTVVKPTIENVLSPNVVVSQKGKVPFTVMHDGVDLTSTITDIVVTGGKYVQQTAFNTGDANVWEVIKSEVAGVTAPVKFAFKVIAKGIQFSLEQSANFVIAPFNDAVLDIHPAAASATVGVGKPGSMKFTGSWGSNNLADNVELDLANSQLGTLITVDGTTPNSDGSITVNYTGGSSLASGNVVLRFKVKNGNATPVEGYDWKDVTLGIEVMLIVLETVSPFETVGTGTQYAPALLQQQVSYNGVVLENDDPNLKISMSSGTKVGISTVYPESISYRFLETITAETTHRPSVIFEYKGVAKITVPLTLTQQTVEGNPTVADVTDAEVEDGKTYKLPFKVLSGLDGRDISDTAVLTGLMLNSNTSYFKLNSDDTYTVIYKDTTVDVTGTARFTITVQDAGFETEMVVEVPMTILKFSGNTLKVATVTPVAPTSVIGGNSLTVKVRMERLGLLVPNTDFEHDPDHSSIPAPNTVTSVTNDPDGFSKVFVIKTTVASANTNLVVSCKYSPTSGDTPVLNKTYAYSYVRLLVGTANTLTIMARSNTDVNLGGAVGDVYYVNFDAFYNEVAVPITSSDFTAIALRDGDTSPGAAAKLEIVERVASGVVVRFKSTAWVNFYFDFTYKGVKYSTYHSLSTYSATASTTAASEYKVPQANVAGEFLFTVAQPEYDWVTQGSTPTPFKGPNWTLDNAAVLYGQLVIRDKSSGLVTSTIPLAGLKRDSVGRYHVPVELSHKPGTIEINTPITLDTVELTTGATYGAPIHRSRLPVSFVTQNLPGAPVLSTIDNNEVNTSTEKTTSVDFRLTQARKSGLYRFISTFVYTSIEGPATYVANGIKDPVTHTQFISLKGTGTTGDVLVKGTITDEDGVVYPVTLKLKAADPSQVEFILVDDVVDAFEQETVNLGASATYQGANLPLNHAAVTITANPAEWVEIVSVSADEIVVKVIKDATADETFTADIILTAYGETHKQELTVNLKTAVPPLEFSGIGTIIGGNLDTGSAGLVITHNGNNVAVNDSKLTFTVASDFTITEFKVSSFLYEITTPLGEKGPKTVNVKVEYEVSPGIVAKGEFDQPMTITDPSDYPRITANPTFGLREYLYGITPNTLTIMSGTTDISTLCEVTNVTANDWILEIPEEHKAVGKWFWVVNGPVSGQAATKTLIYALKIPFRDTFIDMPVQQMFYWAGPGFPTYRDTWVVNYSPTPVAYAPGETGHIEFDLEWAGLGVTEVTINSPTITGLSFSEAVVQDGKLVIEYTHTSSSPQFVGDAVFQLTKQNVGNVTPYITKAASVTFKAKNNLVLTFTGGKAFTGGFGDAAIGVPYTCTNNGTTFNVTQTGVTITTVPAGVIEYVNSASGKMNFKFVKKVDEDTLDNVQVFVNFESDKSNGEELSITSSPRFVLEPLPVLGIDYKYHTNQYISIAMTAWYGTQRVRPTSPDIKFTRSSSIFDAVGDNILIAITHGKGSINSPITITYVPTGTVKTSSLTTTLSDNTSTSATALSTTQAVANEAKQLQFQVRIAATIVNIDNFSDLKLTSVPANGNSILTQSPMQYVTPSDRKLIGADVTTGWTGTGLNITGFIASGDANYKGWWKVNNTFNNIAQAPVTGTTEKQEYNPELTPITVKFKLEQMQGSSKVSFPTGAFGEIVTGGEIASAGPISASGDANFPYSIDIVPTGNVGAGTLTGIIRINGIDQNYTVNVVLQTPQLKLTSTVGGSSAAPVDISLLSPAKLPLTLMYGDQLLANNDPNVKWTITFGTISLALRRQFVDQTNFWVAGINQALGVVGSNNITAELIDQPGKKSTLQVFVKFVAPPQADWTSAFWTTSLPAKNADTKWIGTIGNQAGEGYGLGDSYEHYVEVITPTGSQKPVLNVPSNQAPNDPSGNRKRYVAMTTGWTGGTVTLQGVIRVDNNWYNINATQITIPQESLTVKNITNEVGNDPVEVFFDLTQVRGTNGGPIVDIANIEGVGFKTITFNSAIVESVANVKQYPGDNFSMVVTRKAGDLTNGTVPISMVVTVEGVDYLTVVNTTFTVPTPLASNDGFETTGRGNQDNPVTLNQSVYLPN